ncbi:MAG: lasso peptide isopeptide bond-forming cyclase [Candidatus Omnitrophica bacterium]|nr:lasso peptide isopeptide bond-forming cyclase [Candidatus Omnitrophota bacterium]
MSGMVGTFFLDGRGAETGLLHHMLEKIIHRGPDGVGAWADGPAGFGHCMLWTTPESLQERLPLVHRAGDLAITADARIDNREEILSCLGNNRGSPSGITDSELILLAYEEWAEGCIERLLGDFAFAIWNRKKKELFCARDHFGIKPFYYFYRSGRLFAFASEIKALFGSPEVPRRLNEVRVGDYLVFVLEDKAITFYKEIFRLPPAHAMVVAPQGIRLWRYWALDPSRELHLRSDEEYALRFRELFTQAVRCRSRSSFPVGCTLSGGLDSSSVVCVARKLLARPSKPLPTFSIVFPKNPECDESRFQQAVIAGDGIRPHFISADGLSPLGELDKIFFHQDEPFLAPNLFLPWNWTKAAHQAGVRILLDGNDGDTVVSHGRGYLSELLHQGRWLTLLREARALSGGFHRSSATRILWRLALNPAIPPQIRRAWRWLHGRRDWFVIERAVVHPQFAQRIALKERVETLLATRRYPPRTEREGHWMALTGGMIPYALELMDKIAAAFGLEARHPFFDRRVAEFCLSLPGEQKLKRGLTRRILRNALADLLPQEVRSRIGKSNLGTNFTKSFLSCDQKLIEQAIVQGPRKIGPYVRPDILRRELKTYRTQGVANDGLGVWSSVTLDLWLLKTGLVP